MSVAAEIFKHIGGNKFMAITWAKNWIKWDNFLWFQLPNGKPANYVKIIYDSGNDLYDIEFNNVRGTTIKFISKEKGIYVDQLLSIIESKTWIRCSF